ncbi:amino acid ABC transporter substrate-binding protein [Actinobacteria bacterium YIM 96077]|uniref:Amino acid ABC transporter substrate-binding protein n=1 Tax=Phytoactinopolyspora halophila TaxID=1981511 RepID=A0A329QSY9_9ACTN|nr:amino acid ABC transporter substrate-binding protein [Phytoactinopolyspora halophila]AYY14968.1 amino acid ABC transporter substrate-binding protein [Actinobacteria bacterium YIM 96077]RAW15425.1 amino acid ABC transporter substrate-binding protein [Phytoactinopolyspora halophila]
MRITKLLAPSLVVPALFLAACTDDGGGDNGEPALPDDEMVEGADEDAPGNEDGDDAGSSGGTLAEVRDRGVLNCGINGAVPGFGFVTPEGEYEGFDVEFCRVVAAAVLGDADAVDYTELTAETRFAALQAREIDVLIRNTTWTSSRDGSESGSFTTTTFYDGQGMMVRADDGFESLDDMDGTAICTLSGTTTELNLESAFSARGLDYEPLTFEDNDTLREAFLAERCDGWTSDKSQLAAFRAEWPEEEGGSEALTVLDETMSKEPLGPVTLDGDDEWHDAVHWAVIATIQAWEFGIDSSNVEDFLDADPEEDPEIARFLGIDDFDPGLGLDPDFAVNILEQVGNYQEIYERTVGPDTALGLEPGLNNLWTEGGLLYPPPYR